MKYARIIIVYPYDFIYNHLLGCFRPRIEGAPPPWMAGFPWHRPPPTIGGRVPVHRVLAPNPLQNAAKFGFTIPNQTTWIRGRSKVPSRGGQGPAGRHRQKKVAWPQKY